MPVMKRRSFGVPEMLLFLSVAILVIVVAVPVLLILYTSFFVAKILASFPLTSRGAL